MSTPMVRIHNSQTDEIIDREMNAEELAQLETDKVNQAKSLEEKIQTQADKAALLAKLGITADEAKLLLS